MAFTYTTLRNMIADSAENEEDSFTDNLDNFIDIASQRIAHELDNYGLVEYAYTSVTASTAFVAKPSTTLIVKSLSYQDSNNDWHNLTLKTDEYLAEYWPSRTDAGTPKYWAQRDGDTLQIAPTFTSVTRVEMSFVRQPPALTSAAPSNWITEKASWSLYYAAMVEACMYMKEYQAAGQWEQKYQQSIQMLRETGRRERRDDNRWSKSPMGGDNTLGDRG